MKTDTHGRHLALALLAAGSLLTLTPAGASDTKKPSFSEIPGVTDQTPGTVPATPPPVTPSLSSPVPMIQNPPPQAPSPAPASAQTMAEEETKHKSLYSSQATDLDLKSALAAFARANSLNIVPDNDVAGTVTLDVRDLPLKQIMRALLEANDCTWNMEGGLIRVHSTETRVFNIDYLRMKRQGVGNSMATLGAGTT